MNMRGVALRAVAALLLGLALFAFIEGDEVFGLLFLPGALIAAFGPIVEAERRRGGSALAPNESRAAERSDRYIEGEKSHPTSRSLGYSALIWLGSAGSFAFAGLRNESNDGETFLTVIAFAMGSLVTAFLVAVAAIFVSTRKQ